MAEQLNAEIQMIRSKRLAAGLKLDEERYVYEDRFIAASGLDPLELHTTSELAAFLESDAGKSAEVDARVLASVKGEVGIKKLGREKFLEHFNANKALKTNARFREAFDCLSANDPVLRSGTLGDDYVPLLGGPFHKQLYMYDYLRMHALSFQAYHHDPLAKSVIQMTRDFTMGRGFRVDCKNKRALALWRAFEEANSLHTFMEHFALELAIYGEQMIWWLPGGESRITSQLSRGQTVPKGILPRVRLIDPSVIWEIVTYPEDITRVLFYQWVAPTQYQIYTGRDQGASVPGTKFIFQQIPGGDVDHWKVNSVSNEKRGRSDLFPILGYLKRLRDTIGYGIVALQKSAAWSIDTMIDGSAADVDAYISAQMAEPSIPTAGSERVHTKKVEHKYLGNEAMGRAGNSPAFEWCLDMIAAGSRYPVSYFGSHLSGQGTRAGAIVATEPVAKFLEMRQLVYERALRKMARRLFDGVGMHDAEIEVTFPEIILGDRSAKLKDLVLSESQGWISPKRAATIAAKELQITDYEWEREQKDVRTQDGGNATTTADPLSAPGALASPSRTGDASPSALPSDERKAVKKNALEL